MNRRRNIILAGRTYGCIEILYKNRSGMHEKTSVCVACYVSLPKSYHCIIAAYGNACHFGENEFSKIVYSFLIFPVSNEIEADSILNAIREEKILAIYTGKKRN